MPSPIDQILDQRTAGEIYEESMADWNHENRSGNEFRVLLLVRYVHEDSACSVEMYQETSVVLMIEQATTFLPSVRETDSMRSWRMSGQRLLGLR